jgi:long-subunit acyl-CoA synthetase (AMP-forming)
MKISLMDVIIVLLKSTNYLIMEKFTLEILIKSTNSPTWVAMNVASLKKGMTRIPLDFIVTMYLQKALLLLFQT